MKLEVLTVGTELLLGATLDTNAADLGRALAAAGAEIVRHDSVPDRPEPIRAAVREALERTGFVVVTGGLGPTRDDMTKTVVAELFGLPLEIDAALLAAIEARFRRLARGPVPAVNRTQAEVPRGAVVLPNPRGTAPGLWIADARDRVAVLLPGVPAEMRGLLVEQVLPRIAERVRAEGGARVVRSRTVRTTGVPESALAERVGPLEDGLAPLSLAYLPGVDGVDLRLTAWNLPPEEADRRLADGVERLRRELGDRCYGVDEDDLAAVVLDLVRARKGRIATAESCTGGLVGGRLTAVAGASDVYVGGVVAYANDVKRGLLGVPGEILETHGAVSEPAVRAMAEGVAAVLRVDCTVAVTGIAGPGGGTPDKPVGTVWLAAHAGGATVSVRRVFGGDRDEIRRRSAQAVLDLLRRQILGA